MNIQIQKYRPTPFKLIDFGTIINLFEKEVLNTESIVFEGKVSNSFSGLFVSLGLIILPILLSINIVISGPSIAEFILMGIGSVVVLVGIVSMQKTIKKLRDPKQKSSLVINKNGIVAKNTTPTFYSNLKWTEVSEIAVKIFPTKRAPNLVYLLIITNQNKLIDIDLSLLKIRAEGPLKKTSWLDMFKGEIEFLDELMGVAQKYRPEKEVK